MDKGWTDEQMFNFLNGFIHKETKKEMTNKYITGLINKDEFIKRMKECESDSRYKD